MGKGTVWFLGSSEVKRLINILGIAIVFIFCSCGVVAPGQECEGSSRSN
jgi:hypothetical protein